MAKSFAGYSVQVKWDGTNWVEEWGNVKNLVINRGRDAGILSQPSIGRLDLVVKNEDKRFSPAYVSSPIYANLKPGKDVRVRAAQGKYSDLDGSSYFQMSTDDADFKIVTSLSFGCVFKRSGAAAAQRLIAKADPAGDLCYQLMVDDADGVVAQAEIAGTSYEVADATATGTGWMMAIVTFDNETLKLYVVDLSDNSITTDTATAAGDITDSTEKLTIGADSAGGNKFTGYVAYPFVRDEWLTSDDVQRIVNRGVAFQALTTHLKGWWTFRNSSAVDDSGNSNTLGTSGTPTYAALTDLYDVFLFTGFTRRFRMETEQRQAHIDCESLLSPLSKHDNTVALVTSQDTGALVDDVLDAFGWDADDRLVDEGLSTVGVAGWTGQASQILAQLADREHGLFIIDPAGWPAFENRDYRRQGAGVVSQVHFDGSALVADTAYELDDERIYNDVIIRSRPSAVQATSVLWTLQDTPLIRSGEDITFVARFRDANTGLPVKAGSVISPASATDYVANSQAGGGGADRTANLTVTATIKAEQASLLCEASADLYITKLQIRGARYEVYDAVEIEKEDGTSQTAYQKRTLEVGNQFYDDVVDSEEYAEMLLERFKDPYGRVNPVFVSANRNIDQLYYSLMLSISDRITLTDTLTGLDGEEFYVEKVTHNVQHGDTPHHVVIWIVEPVNTYGYWELGTSEFDAETTLAY